MTVDDDDRSRSIPLEGPPTPEWVLLLIVVVVAAGAAVIAYGFRAAGLEVLELLGDRDPTEVADTRPRWSVAITVGAAVAAAAVLARIASRHPGSRAGLRDIARAARGRDRAPSVAATTTRATGTWLASATLVSVGRESAILEAGGTLGAVAGRRASIGRGGIVSAGVAAAFAGAYHAPLAGALYVEEHLGVRRRPRAMVYVLVAVAVSHLLTQRVLGSHAIFEAPSSLGWRTLAMGVLAVVPAVVGSRLFLLLRRSLTARARDRLRFAVRVAVGATVAGAAVALVPLTAGNGMEGIRAAGAEPVVSVALALAAGKIVATTAALAAGVPGGAFSPTMATSAGWALLAFLGLEAAGMTLPGEMWDGVLVAMAVGLAVGIRAPWTAAFAVPEMAGTLGLVPVTLVAVGAAVALGRGVDALLDRRRAHRTVRDDDA